LEPSILRDFPKNWTDHLGERCQTRDVSLDGWATKRTIRQRFVDILDLHGHALDFLITGDASHEKDPISQPYCRG
jgi:hypothetical protein